MKTINLLKKIAAAMIAASVFSLVVEAGPPDDLKIGAKMEALEKQGIFKHASPLAHRPFLSVRGAPANPKVYGKTYGEWGAAWWKWALSFPAGMNPVEDTTGEYCDLGQSGPVWFLAGSFQETGIERTCTIPAGKALFYPIRNSVWTDCPESPDEDLSDEDVRLVLALFTGAGDNACQLTSTLDTFKDTPVLDPIIGPDIPAPISALQRPAVRSQSPVFTWQVPVEGPVLDFQCPDGSPGLQPGEETGRSIAEGHWAMLPPLSVGEHVLNLHSAECNPYTGEVNGEVEVTYYLTVVPGKGK